jgi:hypothetical protein
VRDLSFDRIIFKLILWEEGLELQSGFNWLRMWSLVGFVMDFRVFY